jgi:hypothetical protein
LLQRSTVVTTEVIIDSDIAMALVGNLSIMRGVFTTGVVFIFGVMFFFGVVLFSGVMRFFGI